MKKNKFIIIISFLFIFSFVTRKSVHAVGGRNGECIDADITGYTKVSNDVKYKAPDGEVVEGVCIKAGNDMFGDGHSSKITEDFTYNNCYRISGLGTENIRILRIGEGDKCKEISHLDLYFSKADVSEKKQETSQPEDLKNEDVRDNPAESEDPVQKQEDSIDDHPAGGIVENEPVEDTDNEDDEDEEEDDVFERDEEGYENEVLALSEIKELPKTGFRSVVGSIGFLLTTLGYTLKYIEKKKRII